MGDQPFLRRGVKHLVRQYCRAVAIAFALGLATAPALADVPLPAVASRPAMPRADAAHTMLLGGTRVGNRLIAVGLHGVVVLSDDSGLTWRQVPVPTSVALTDVAFASPKDGWIIGHMGLVLRTSDGGETWTRQFDGTTAAHLALQAAEQAASGPGDPKALRAAVRNARQLVTDGPDKPFLAIQVTDPDHALIVGAYGIAFDTADGGVHWRPELDQFDDGGGWHLYALARVGSTRYAAGEQGIFLRSLSGGRFQAFAMPASVSVFGLVTAKTAKTGRVIAFGLNGSIEYSDDQGQHWSSIGTGVNNAITSGLVLADGRILLASQVGQLLVSADHGTHFRVLGFMSPQPVAALVQAADGSIITLGPSGAMRLTLDKIAGNS